VWCGLAMTTHSERSKSIFAINLHLSFWSPSNPLKRIIFRGTESADNVPMSETNNRRRRKIFLFLALCLGLAILAPVAVLAA